MPLRKDLFAISKKRRKVKKSFLIARCTAEEKEAVVKRYGSNVSRAIRLALGIEE